MITYLIIALSFSLSSLWFIHKRALAMYNIVNYLVMYDFAYIIACTIFFPIIFISWVFNSEEFIKIYGKSLSEVIE